MAFDRWQPFPHRTVAYTLFKRHHTHLNSIFWAYSAAKCHAFNATRCAGKDDAVETVFVYAKNNKRLNVTLGKWAEDFNAFDSWTRYAAILAVAGYLETFLSNICGAALESCPAITFGGGREIDGIALLKNRPGYCFADKIEPIVRGVWTSRVNAYKKLFTTCPFEQHISQLEQLRLLRNNAGHCFGRDISMMTRPDTAQVVKLTKLTDARLIKFLNLAEVIAIDVEAQLGCGYVGNYEIFRFYHEAHSDINRLNTGVRNQADAFSTKICNLVGCPCGKDYATKIIKWYEKA